METNIKNRLTTAVSGIGVRSNQLANIELDPCEYYIQIHPSGHYQIELPECDLAYHSASIFENEVILRISMVKF